MAFFTTQIKMKPKEKAKELIHHYTKELLSAKYSINGFVIEQLAKQCSLIAVEEILSNNCGTNTDGQQAYEEEIYCDEYFWHDVKEVLQSS
jgi:transketolase